MPAVLVASSLLNLFEKPFTVVLDTNIRLVKLEILIG